MSRKIYQSKVVSKSSSNRTRDSKKSKESEFKVLGKHYQAIACMASTGVATEEDLLAHGFNVKSLKNAVENNFLEKEIVYHRVWGSYSNRVKSTVYHLNDKGEKFSKDVLGIRYKTKLSSVEHGIPFSKKYFEVQDDMKDKGFKSKDIALAMSSWKSEEELKKECFKMMKDYAEDKSNKWGIDFKEARRTISAVDAIVTILDRNDAGETIEVDIAIEAITDNYSEGDIAAKETFIENYNKDIEIHYCYQEGHEGA